MYKNNKTSKIIKHQLTYYFPSLYEQLIKQLTKTQHIYAKYSLHKLDSHSMYQSK